MGLQVQRQDALETDQCRKTCRDYGYFHLILTNDKAKNELEPRKDVVASDHLKREDGGQRCRFSGNDKKDVKPENLVQELRYDLFCKY